MQVSSRASYSRNRGRLEPHLVYRVVCYIRYRSVAKAFERASPIPVMHLISCLTSVSQNQDPTALVDTERHIESRLAHSGSERAALYEEIIPGLSAGLTGPIRSANRQSASAFWKHSLGSECLLVGRNLPKPYSFQSPAFRANSFVCRWLCMFQTVHIRLWDVVGTSFRQANQCVLFNTAKTSCRGHPV